ncbi:Ig-like domain-containing protein [Flavobacterium ajazii]|uniref:Ig-like domain-containing protein n=1 Tax=Flavobacterium ajazii TaxID=2692318 RepID=UPI0013D5DE89|nr:T9SS type B sorting domain-containing protein [Flavobacterium ajazii]
MKKTLLVFLIFSGFICSSQKTSIPDPNFEKALIDLGIDSGSVDGWVSSLNIANVKSLDIPGKNISDLTGIEGFLKLEQLNVGILYNDQTKRNNISSLNLSNNIYLKHLRCEYNNLTYLNLSNNTQLNTLYISYNKFNSIDISKNTALTTFDCQENNISYIDVTKNTYLTGLDVSANKLTNLDISKNLLLTSLSYYNNQLTNIDISKHIKIKHFNIGFNKLSNIDVSKNTALEFLNCENNQLPNLDISTNTLLAGLESKNNLLTHLDVSKNTGLIRLNCSFNQLSNIDVSKNLLLNDFTISNNQLTGLDVSKNTALKQLGCGYNNLTNIDISKNIILYDLSIHNNQIANLDVTKNTVLVILNCQNNQLTDLNVSKNNTLVNFYCQNNQLTNLNLKNGKNTKLSFLNFKSNPNLSCIQVDNATYSNTNWSTYKDASATYLNNCNTINSTAPKLTATGNQLYCPNTDINIVTDFSITHDASETGTHAVYIQISSGYAAGFDKLRLLNPSSYPNIVENWDTASGKLTLSSPTGIDVLYSDFISAVKNVVFSNPSVSASGAKTFSITIGQANYLPSTGHFYQFVPNIGITWTEAKAAAENSTYYGLQGYLATISAADEAKLSGEQASGAGWIGGSDAETENVWKWVTGPEGLANDGKGTIFWNGLANGSTPNFALWNNNEPNQAGDEDYAHITAPGIGIPGSWNDLRNEGQPSGDYQAKGYIVEYGGMPGESPLEIATSTQITIPEATITNPNPICDSGSLNLKATSNAGTIRWYDAAVGGHLLGTGTSYTTPIINTSTTYYADAGCETNRRSVTAIVNTTPDVPIVSSPVARCGTGTVTLQATSNLGIINWFATSTGGTSLYTGNNFITPAISVNTTYYAEASNNGCINSTRTPVNIIIYTPPIVTDEEVVLCENQTVILDAKISGMTYKWSTGQTSQTIEVNIKGTYSVEVTSPSPENCTSNKTITVIEYKKPIIKNIDVKERAVTINVSNPQDYFEYSVDGANYQTSNLFYNVPGGLQTAYVRAQNNLCNSNEATQSFIVLIIPSFFTPNNDSYNDFWEVTGMENYPKAQVTIFDQYGKLLAQLSGSKLSWDGTFNKSPLPSSDYWYVLKIDDANPVFKGHFSLKR